MSYCNLNPWSPPGAGTWGPPPPRRVVKSEASQESESDGDSDPSPLELDLDLALLTLAPPPAVHRRTGTATASTGSAGGRWRTTTVARAPSPVSPADFRVVRNQQSQRADGRVDWMAGRGRARGVRGRGPLPSGQRQRRRQQHQHQQERGQGRHYAERQGRAVAAAAPVWNDAGASNNGIGTTIIPAGSAGTGGAPGAARARNDGGAGDGIGNAAAILPAWPGTDPADPFRNDDSHLRIRSAATAAAATMSTATAHSSSGSADQCSQLRIQRALLRGDVPMGFDADRGEVPMGSEPEPPQPRRGANVLGYCPPSEIGTMRAEARHWAALLAEYPAPPPPAAT